MEKINGNRNAIMEMKTRKERERKIIIF